MIKWYSARATEKHRRATLKAFDLVDTLEDETDVTVEQIEQWDDGATFDWLEAWGFEWDVETMQWRGES